MRFEGINCIVGLIKDGAKLACASAVYVHDAWYHRAPDYKEPVEIKDANPNGVAWPDYIGYQLPCPECGSEMVDAGYATEDETVLECRRCGHMYHSDNTSYHSDHPDAKIGSPDFNIDNEPDPNEILGEIASHLWVPSIPRNRNELWDLQRHLSVFRKIAKSYNNWIKSLDKEIRYLKTSKKKDEARLSYLFNRKKGRKFISGVWVFDTYCDRVGADPDAASWIVHNWEALNIKDDYEKSDIEDRMPMAKNDEDEWEEREFDSESFRGVAEHTRYTDEEMWIIGYVAKMLIKRPYICAKKVTASNARSRIKVYLLDLIDIVLEAGLEHPSTTRWKRWNGMTQAKLMAEVEAEERRLRYEADSF